MTFAIVASHRSFPVPEVPSTASFVAPATFEQYLPPNCKSIHDTFPVYRDTCLNARDKLPEDAHFLSIRNSDQHTVGFEVVLHRCCKVEIFE